MAVGAREGAAERAPRARSLSAEQPHRAHDTGIAKAGDHATACGTHERGCLAVPAMSADFDDRPAGRFHCRGYSVGVHKFIADEHGGIVRTQDGSNLRRIGGRQDFNIGRQARKVPRAGKDDHDARHSEGPPA